MAQDGLFLIKIYMYHMYVHECVLSVGLVAVFESNSCGRCIGSIGIENKLK